MISVTSNVTIFNILESEESELDIPEGNEYFTLTTSNPVFATYTTGLQFHNPTIDT